MAQRKIKTGSTGVEFAAAPQPWQIADLDADLDAIFLGVDNTNIALAAGIATSKLAQDAGIQTGHLAAQAVTQAKLGLLAVGTPQLIVSASLPNYATVAVPAGFGTNTPNTDVLFATLPTITTRGGHVRLSGNGFLTISYGAITTALIKWFRDGVVISGLAVGVSLNASVAIVPIPEGWDQPAAGAHTYTLYVNPALGAEIATNATYPGSLFAVEFA